MKRIGILWSPLLSFLLTNAHEATAASADPQEKIRSATEAVNCDFDTITSWADHGFCRWTPDDGGRALWHSGNAVLVDSANSVVKASSPSSGYDRFAFVRGSGTVAEGTLFSPPISFPNDVDEAEEKWELKLTYWKANVGPSLDVCIGPASAVDPQKQTIAEGQLNCIDSITGPGQRQWVRRTIELPPRDGGATAMTNSFRIFLVAKNIAAAEDIICVDDIRLVRTLLAKKQTPTTTKSTTALETHLISVTPENSRQQKPVSVLSASLQRPVTTTLGISESSNDNFGLIKSQGPQISRHPVKSQPELLVAKMNTGNGNVFGSNSLLPSGTCSALKCSFLTEDDSCQWLSDGNWSVRGNGNIAMEGRGSEGMLESAWFKVPLFGSPHFEFNLWMSDNSDLTVIEELDSNSPKGSTSPEQEFVLLNRRGSVEENGWRRFRVPLRIPPLFQQQQEARIRILGATASAEGKGNGDNQDNFIALSGIRLVNGNGEEMGCETVSSNPNPIHRLAPSKIDVTKSDPGARPDPEAATSRSEKTTTGVLKINPSLPKMPPLKEKKPLLTPTLLSVFPQKGSDAISSLPQFPLQLATLPPPFVFPTFPPPQSPPELISNGTLALFPTAPLAFGLPSAVALPSSSPLPTTSWLFNPFKPMLEGFLPIVPVKRGTLERLTALQQREPYEQREISSQDEEKTPSPFNHLISKQPPAQLSTVKPIPLLESPSLPNPYPLPQSVALTPNKEKNQQKSSFSSSALPGIPNTAAFEYLRPFLGRSATSLMEFPSLGVPLDSTWNSLNSEAGPGVPMTQSLVPFSLKFGEDKNSNKEWSEKLETFEKYNRDKKIV